MNEKTLRSIFIVAWLLYGIFGIFQYKEIGILYTVLIFISCLMVATDQLVIIKKINQLEVYEHGKNKIQ